VGLVITYTWKFVYLDCMNNFKNVVIAVLTGLLVLTLSSPNTNAGSNETKSIEYSACLMREGVNIIGALRECKKYRP